MRQGHNNNNNNNNKRMRGRSRKGPNPLQRSFESNGPDVKIRGTAMHIAEKYVMLARDAASSGDRVGEQNYLQHAEHYYRIVAAAQAQMPQAQPFQRPDEFEDDDDLEGGAYDRPQGDGRQQFGVGEPQPYVNGAPFGGGQEGEGEGDFDAAQPEQPRRPQQNEYRQNGYNNRQRDNYRQDRQQGEYRGQGGQGQGEFRQQGEGRQHGEGRQGGEYRRDRQQGEYRQQGDNNRQQNDRQQNENRQHGENRAQGEYRQQEFRQNDFRQQQPRPVDQVNEAEPLPQAIEVRTPEPQPEGEPRVQAEGGNFSQNGEQPRFRSRGRRSGRGRARPEGGDAVPVGEAAQPSPPVAAQSEPIPVPATED